MKRKILIAFAILLIIYVSGYVLVRQTHQEIWERDGKSYVIFPEDKILYYLFRPLTIVDEKITGINFHIGQHR